MKRFIISRFHDFTKTNFPKCCFKPAVLANQRIHGQYANMNSSRSDTANSNIRSCQPIEGDYPI
ncbi:4636_t:CDS:2, partial [Entrophospora sp. SA101]